MVLIPIAAFLLYLGNQRRAAAGSTHVREPIILESFSGIGHLEYHNLQAFGLMTCIVTYLVGSHVPQVSEIEAQFQLCASRGNSDVDRKGCSDDRLRGQRLPDFNACGTIGLRKYRAPSGDYTDIASLTALSGTARVLCCELLKG